MVFAHSIGDEMFYYITTESFQLQMGFAFPFRARVGGNTEDA